MTSVGAIADGHSRVFAERPIELAVADVDGHDSGSATLQEAVDEASGGTAEVADVFTGHADSQRCQRMVELVAAARHKTLPRHDFEHGARVNLRAGLVDDTFVDAHLPCEYRRLRLGA